MIKLFCTDLDQTLLVDHKIPQENLIALKELRKRGVHLAFVSGRVLSSLEYLAETCQLKISKIATNGAICKDEEGNVFYKKPMSKKSVDQLVRIAKEEKLYFHLYDEENYYSYLLHPAMYSHLLKEKRANGNIYQCGIVISEDLSKVEALKIQIMLGERKKDRIFQRLKDVEKLHFTFSNKGLFEAMDEEVNKWETVIKLAKRYQIQREEIACIGDYLNDKEMVEKAGLGIAVANGHPDLISVSDWQVRAYDEFGLKEAVDRLIASKLV